MNDKSFWNKEVRLVTGEPSAIKDYVAKSFEEIKSKEFLEVFRINGTFGLAFEDSFYRNRDDSWWVQFWAVRATMVVLSQKPDLMKKMRKKNLQEAKKKMRAAITPQCDQVFGFNFRESPAYHNFLVELIEEEKGYWLLPDLLGEIQDIYKQTRRVPVLFFEGLESIVDQVNEGARSIPLSSPLLDRSPVIGLFKFFQECQGRFDGLNPRVALSCEIWDKAIFCNRSHLCGRTIDLRR